VRGPLRVAFVLVVCAATVATAVLGVVISVHEPDYFIVLMGLWAILGAIVVALRPTNAVGWLFLAVGLLWTSGLTATAGAEHLHSGRALTFFSWLSEWFWILGFALMIASLFVIPTGRVPSPRWRPVLGVFAASAVVVAVVASLEEKLQASDRSPVVRNPIGIGGLGDVEVVAPAALFVVLLGGAILATASLVFRFRRAGPAERQQIELIAIAAPFAVVCAVLGGITGGTGIEPVFWTLAIALVPVAVTVAILRRRLFDVDLLISRTLVYGLLTVLLGAAYVGLVLAGQAVFSSFAGGSDLAIAVSTLVVAALFLPVRARVQRFVDQRFFRRRYDAQRTLAAFGARLREETDIEALTHDLRRVVEQTMQPAHLAIWVRTAR
jgi:hypothetical protein